MEKSNKPSVPIFVVLTTYMTYLLIFFVGHVRDFFGKRFKPKDYEHLKQRNGLAPLYSDFESFYTKRVYLRLKDCFNRPIEGVPGRFLSLMNRETLDYNRSFNFVQGTTQALNFGSYNYLGFAGYNPQVEEALKQGISTSSSRNDVGSTELVVKLEKAVAEFLGTEACLTSSIGFATNSTNIPSFAGKGCLIFSDALNHSSLIFGCRLSGATIKVFNHNDPIDLEKKLRRSIAEGHPRTRRPWKKILVFCEGLYSMEGTICNLPAFVGLREKYKAHSIGALGATGRGVCEHFGIKPEKVDILMGTFTKSFGAAGGYICGSKQLIDRLRLGCSSTYTESVSIPVAQQIITAFSHIQSEEGKSKLDQIKENSKYFHTELVKMGFLVYGEIDSPVVPVLLFNLGKVAAFSRMCLERGLAVVVVGYPATPMIETRARFCISSSHTREDLDRALAIVSEIGDILMLKYGSY